MSIRSPIRILLITLILIFSGLALWLGGQIVTTLKAPRVPVLLYHHLTVEDNLPSGCKYFTPQKVFADEMQYLHANGYQVIPLRQLIEYMEFGGDLPEKPMVLTFDDGYESNYTLAYPVLQQYQMPATIFLEVSKAGMHDPKDIPRLSWEQMREMEESGLIEIQAHTYDLHQKVTVDPALSQTQPAVIARAYLRPEQRRETPAEYENKLLKDFIQARETIEENLSPRRDILCWPYGAYNTDALRLAHQAGFKYFVTCRTGMNQYRDSTGCIRRISVGGEIPLDRFIQLIEPDYSLVRQARQIGARYLNWALEWYIK